MVTATIGREHYKTQMFVAGHKLIADEPTDLDGTNLGPTPGHFIHMALASCTAITLRMYADRKQWPVEKIRVEVDSERIENKTIMKCDIYIEGALDEQQKQRLQHIANAYPVHKTLTQPIEITTVISYGQKSIQFP